MWFLNDLSLQPAQVLSLVNSLRMLRGIHTRCGSRKVKTINRISVRKTAIGCFPRCGDLIMPLTENGKEAGGLPSPS